MQPSAASAKSRVLFFSSCPLTRIPQKNTGEIFSWHHGIIRKHYGILKQRIFSDFLDCSVMFPRVLCFPWDASE